jgi:DNA-binding winged helix-turn-helix (wHTH) protein/tetratricopeptide (TPR) repeat protein
MRESGSFEFGTFRLDADKSVLWRGEDLVPLTPKALALLRALVERGGDVVSKTELMGRVWPDTVVEEGNLTVLVAALRKGLDPRPGGGSFVQTVPRRGYRFDAPLRTSAGARPLAIAVLPFTTLGPDTDPHVGVAIADSLTGRLTAHESLLVRPTLAVAHYARASKPPREAAQELGVDAVLTGTVQRQGTRIRVSVQFVPRPAALRPWAETFEADGTDLFALQDAVAEGVARVLWPRLPGPPPAGRARTAARDAAREAYQRGRFFWSRFTPHALGKAFGHFGESLALDPGYAPPYAGLADAHLLLGLSGLTPPSRAWDLALECAERAQACDPGHAEAYAARAYARLFQALDWTAARADLDKAVSLAPETASVHLWRGLFRTMGGDFEGARSDLRTGRAIDPLSVVASACQCFLHEIAEEPEEELELARASVELRPDCFLGHRCLGMANIMLGRAQFGLQALRQAVERTQGGPVMRALAAWAQAHTGDRDGARQELAELDALAASTFISPCARARVLVALGEFEPALRRLEEAVAQRDGVVLSAAVDPLLAPLRTEAAFRALLADIGGPAA